MTGKTPSPKDSKRPLPDSVAQPLAQFEAAVHGMEEQVREVNARIDKRAGRPLWLAITFGLLLGGIFVASLFVLTDFLWCLLRPSFSLELLSSPAL